MEKERKKVYSFIVGTMIILNILTIVSASVESDFFNLLNQERQSLNVSALSNNPQLKNAAYLHSKDMGENHYFSHTSLDGRTFVNRIVAANYTDYRALGENIGYHTGFAEANKIFSMWKSSPGHYKNMISPNFADAGLGVYYAGNSMYYTLDLGKNRNSVIINTTLPNQINQTNSTSPASNNSSNVANQTNVTGTNNSVTDSNYNFSYKISGRYVDYFFIIKDPNFYTISYSKDNQKSKVICSWLKNKNSCFLRSYYTPGKHTILFEIKNKQGQVNNNVLSIEIL